MKKLDVIAAETHSSEYLLHKYWARKPHNILAHFISELVPKGGIVVDPCCGSGVAIHEAQKQGHTAYGFDINPIACLISQVLINPPNIDDLKDVITKILNDAEDKIQLSYSEGKKSIRYCVHSIIAKCPHCGTVQKQSEAIIHGKTAICHICNEKIRFNLEYLIGTEITSVVYENEKEPDCSQKTLSDQLDLAYKNVFQTDTSQFDFQFAENRRILAFSGMRTSNLFTPRNFSILCYLARKIAEINDSTIRKAAQLLLSASIAQCSRLIAARNNLSTGGPAWSIPGFWVPAVHLETNPIIHLRARLQKFSKGLSALNSLHNKGKAIVSNLDSRKGLEWLIGKGIAADFVFFDPPYGDNVPYLEFSSMWNSFLGQSPDPNTDVSVSDRLPKNLAWDRYNQDLSEIIAAIKKALKPNGCLLITFNNNDMRAWKALLSALQIQHMKCNFVTYQIPAVVSSKAQKAIENSYISDIYVIFNPDNNWTPSKSLTDVSNALIKCAKFREGKISYSLAQRALIMAWLEFNVSADLLNDSEAIIDSVFDKNGNELVLKERQIDQDKPTFYKEARKIAEKTLSMGPCEWSLIYEKIASETAEYGIPDPHEVKNALEGYVTFDGSRCMAFVQENKQLLFDF